MFDYFGFALMFFFAVCFTFLHILLRPLEVFALQIFQLSRLRRPESSKHMRRSFCGDFQSLKTTLCHYPRPRAICFGKWRFQMKNQYISSTWLCAALRCCKWFVKRVKELSQKGMVGKSRASNKTQYKNEMFGKATKSQKIWWIQPAMSACRRIWTCNSCTEQALQAVSSRGTTLWVAQTNPLDSYRFVESLRIQWILLIPRLADFGETWWNIVRHFDSVSISEFLPSCNLRLVIQHAEEQTAVTGSCLNYLILNPAHHSLLIRMLFSESRCWIQISSSTATMPEWEAS